MAPKSKRVPLKGTVTAEGGAMFSDQICYDFFFIHAVYACNISKFVPLAQGAEAKGVPSNEEKVAGHKKALDTKKGTGDQKGA
jgi:hypothetical protein